MEIDVRDVLRLTTERKRKLNGNYQGRWLMGVPIEGAAEETTFIQLPEPQGGESRYCQVGAVPGLVSIGGTVEFVIGEKGK